MEEEEKKSDERMAQEVTISVPQVSESKAAVSTKENAPVSEGLKAAKGVPVSKVDGSSNSSKPSVSVKLRKRSAPLKPIEEDSVVPDDSQTRHMGKEELPRNPLETFPPFPIEDDPVVWPSTNNFHSTCILQGQPI